MMDGGKLEQAGHGKSFAYSPTKRFEGSSKKLRFIAQGETYADLTPIYGQDASGGGNR